MRSRLRKALRGYISISLSSTVPIAFDFTPYYDAAFTETLPDDVILSPFQVSSAVGSDATPGIHFNPDEFYPDVSYQILTSNSDPSVRMISPKSWTNRDDPTDPLVLGTTHFPANFLLGDVGDPGVVGTPNNPSILVNRDTGEVKGFNALCRTTIDGDVFGYRNDIKEADRGGSGLLGGYITAYELAHGINHAGVWVGDSRKYLSNNGTGFIAPAVKADTGYATPGSDEYYGGNDVRLKTGVRLAVPRSVTAESLNLTKNASIQYLEMMHNYGVIWGDASAWTGAGVGATADAYAALKDADDEIELIMNHAQIVIGFPNYQGYVDHFDPDQIPLTSTYIDTTGGLQTVKRFDSVNGTLRFDQATKANQPILSEAGDSGNLLTYSQDLSNAAWVKSVTTVSVSAVTHPSGSGVVHKISETAVTNYHSVSQVNSLFSDSTSFKFRAKMRADGTSYALLQCYGRDGGYRSVKFDLINGTVSDAGRGSITPLGDDWYQVQYIDSVSTGANTPVFFLQLDDGSGSSYTGNTANGILVADISVQRSIWGSDYVPTTSYIKYPGVNGKRVLIAQGSQRMNGDAAMKALVNNVSGVSVYAAWSSTAVTGTTARLLTFKKSDNSGSRLTVGRNSSNVEFTGGRRAEAGSYAEITAGSAPGTGQIVTAATFDYANTKADLYRNESSVASNWTYLTAGNTDAVDSGDVVLGDSDGTLPLNGTIGPFVVYQAAHSAAHAAQVSSLISQLAGGVY